MTTERNDAAADFAEWTAWMRRRGVAFAVDADLTHGADHDGALIPERGDVTRVRASCDTPIVEHRDAQAVLAADHATALVMGCMRTHLSLEGRRVLDLGCGTGVIATLAAQRGAHAIASDIQSSALELATRTGQSNGVQFETRQSDIFLGFERDERFDVIIATLPHKPVGDTQGKLPLSQDGGPDGTVLMRRLLDGLPTHLEPGGELVVLIHSLADVHLLRDMGRLGELTLLAWRRRVLQVGEFPDLEPLFSERHEAEQSLLAPHGDRKAMLCGVWRLRPS